MRTLQLALLFCGAAGALCFFTPGVALLCGVLLALSLGNPWSARTGAWAKLLLQIAVAGLGAGMRLDVVATTGWHGIGYTIIGIAGTMLLGHGLGEWLKIPRETRLLLSVGTAICGGSAIAAVASTVRANATNISVALATVFALNALGLWMFPIIGHALAMTAPAFGLWCALAIHDTSSVVGAALAHSEAALQMATPVKLARALWIVPLTLVIGRFWKHPVTTDQPARSTPPWFIAGFVAASAIVTWCPTLQPAGLQIAAAAKHLLVLTLFLIGANISRNTLSTVGWRPLLHGILLWVITATATLAAIVSGVISAG